MEIVLSLALLGATVLILLNARRAGGRAIWILTAALALLGLVGIQQWQPATDEWSELLPPVPSDTNFESSDTCRKCHPDQYQSWHASFHRTMTQPGTPEAVQGNFEDLTLEARGRVYRLFRQDDEFWVEMNDPAWEMRFEGGPLPTSGIPRVRERIVMTTGSHHLQVYWTHRPESNGMIFQFPLVYSLDQQRWVPVEDSFLRPPTKGPISIDIWNSTCIACHAVGGEPFNNAQERTMYSRVAELGIACEACHGPARDHLREQQSPWNRYAYHLAEGTDPAIVNPERLSSRRSSEVCGSCHSASSELDTSVWAAQGRRYRAGQDLEESRFILRYEENPTDPRLRNWVRYNPSGLRDHFWRDGTMRVAGREFNAMRESACYQKGDLSCLSCHSMHEGNPADQLDPDHAGSDSCLQCHEQFQGEVLTNHTHHKSASPGSDCMNCHMPHTTYGLYTGIRSHRIDNPSVDQSTLYGRPNACNLCHLDKTLQWSGRYLTEWYGQSEARLSSEEIEVAASLLWLLKGDAVQRALAAWHLGWAPAQQASGNNWQPPFLAQLLDDPYAVVRFLSGQAIGRQAGFEDFQFDFLADSTERESKMRQVIERWQTAARSGRQSAPAALLMTAPGELNLQLLEQLILERDRRPVQIAE